MKNTMCTKKKIRKKRSKATQHIDAKACGFVCPVCEFASSRLPRAVAPYVQMLEPFGCEACVVACANTYVSLKCCRVFVNAIKDYTRNIITRLISYARAKIKVFLY